MVSTPRSWRRVLVACLATAAAACRPSAAPTPDTPSSLAGAARGWNVVLVTVDTLRADRLGAFGYRVEAAAGGPLAAGAASPSPHLDTLFGQGLRFAEASAQRALTWPSLSSLLSGAYPSVHGVLENGYGLPDGLPTLPLLLQGAGYRTGRFLSNMCKANHQGWVDDAAVCTGGVDGKATRQALEWTAKLDGQKPYLLWVHYFGPHPPYYNGGDLADTSLDPGYDGPLGTKMWMLDQTMSKREPLADRDRRHLDALYDAAVIGSDRHVGDLLAGLASQGRLAKTLVVFAADHGEELAEHHGYFYHACSVYQSTLHVPLGFVAPGLIQPGGVVGHPVELVDVLPTVLDLVGVAAPAGLNGSSLLPYLERPDRGGAGKPAYSEYDTSRIKTVRAGNWKLVVNPDGITPFCFAAVPDLYPIGKQELYDLASDPGETTNVAASNPAKVAELAELLDGRFKGLTSRNQEQTISPELEQELQALGYVGKN